MTARNETVINAFRNRRKLTGGNLRTDGHTLYSCRQPIAIHHNSGTVLHNGDIYSQTTSVHQRLTSHASEPRISYSAVCDALAIDERSLYKTSIIAFTQDEHATYTGESGPAYEEWKRHIPIGATLWPGKRDVGGTWARWQTPTWHRIGSVVLRQDDYDYLCSMDGSQYFVARLPRRVSDVDDAFLSLQPIPVRGRTDVLRQGEWFFMPFTLNELNTYGIHTFSEFKRLAIQRREQLGGFRWICSRRGGWGRRASTDQTNGAVALPRPRVLRETMRPVASGNTHTPTYMLDIVHGHENVLLVAGTVRHREHQMLKLDKGVVYRALRSLSIREWGAQGMVD